MDFQEIKGIMICAANGFAKIGVGGNSNRGKVMGLIVQYW